LGFKENLGKSEFERNSEIERNLRVWERRVYIGQIEFQNLLTMTRE
jgi:hypothetical protein